MKSLKFSALALGFFSLATFTGCSKDESSPMAPMTANQTANVKVIHASPDAPGVDLVVDGAVAKTNLMFPENTSYLAVPAGSRSIKVNVSGTSNTVIAATLPVSENMSYSVFAIDYVSKLSTLVLADNLAKPASGYAHVRFIHLSPNAPAVDIGLTGGPVVWGNKEFKQYTDFTPILAGTYNLEVRLAGTTTVALPLAGVKLDDGKIYTVFARGLVGESGAKALGAQIIVNN